MQHDATSTVSALTPPLQPGERVSALVTGPHRPPTEVLGFVTDLTPENEALLARRDDLQAQIDKWHRHRVLDPHDPEAYRDEHVRGNVREHQRTAAGKAVGR